MSQTYDVALSRRGGFGSLPEAMAHRNVAGKLYDKVKQAEEVATQLRGADLVDVSSTGSELNKDLAAGKGHVIMLSQAGDTPYGAELTYNPTDGSTRSLEIDLPGSKLSQMGGTYKLEEGGVTTFFRHDATRGVLSIMDSEKDVPRLFGDADPAKLTAGTIQLNQPILIF